MFNRLKEYFWNNLVSVSDGNGRSCRCSQERRRNPYADSLPTTKGCVADGRNTVKGRVSRRNAILPNTLDNLDYILGEDLDLLPIDSKFDVSELVNKSIDYLQSSMAELRGLKSELKNLISKQNSLLIICLQERDLLRQRVHMKLDEIQKLKDLMKNRDSKAIRRMSFVKAQAVSRRTSNELCVPIRSKEKTALSIQSSSDFKIRDKIHFQSSVDS